MFHPYHRQFKVLSAVTGISFALFASAHAQYGWTGATSSDPSISTNYNTTPPTYGASNSGTLFIQNGASGSPLSYSSAQGATTFTEIRIGVSTTNGAASGSELDLTGGMLTINSSGTSTIGYMGSGNLGVSGGTLSVNGADQFWFGNTFAVTANVSGTGTVNIGDQFLPSRQGAVVNLNVTGNGVFDVTNGSGTQYNANGGAGATTITLGGRGIFEQTASSAINLAGNANFKINFQSGSLGQFSILNDSTTTLDGLISGGSIEINGAPDTTLTDYTVTGAAAAGSQGTIQLAGVPEPATWAMLLIGALVVFGFQRFSRKSAV
jgi:autotransporter family porin